MRYYPSLKIKIQLNIDLLLLAHFMSDLGTIASHRLMVDLERAMITTLPATINHKQKY